MTARMDGTAEQQLLWRVHALREALSMIVTVEPARCTAAACVACAKNAIAVDDYNAEQMAANDK
jgi:hypothetical protein